MKPLVRGRYVARVAEEAEEVRAAQNLRHLAFHGDTQGLDQDAFDRHCLHVLVCDRASERLVCCFRLLLFPSGRHIARSYSAQFYNLALLKSFDGPMAEMGRFCIHPDLRDPDVVRIAWAAVTRFVDENGVALLFGCVSFKGVEADPYTDAFALLKDRHLAPKRWLPRVKAPAVFRFAQKLRWRRPDARLAMRAMPPLLRSYMVMGGWVSDHAVVDRDMNTLHVFTGLEVGAIPPARARLLRTC